MKIIGIVLLTVVGTSFNPQGPRPPDKNPYCEYDLSQLPIPAVIVGVDCTIDEDCIDKCMDWYLDCAEWNAKSACQLFEAYATVYQQNHRYSYEMFQADISELQEQFDQANAEYYADCCYCISQCVDCP